MLSAAFGQGHSIFQLLTLWFADTNANNLGDFFILKKVCGVGSFFGIIVSELEEQNITSEFYSHCVTFFLKIAN